MFTEKGDYIESRIRAVMSFIPKAWKLVAGD
jgi:hypothetical protein